MSAPCPVSMLTGGGSKIGIVVLGALVVLALAAAQSKKPVTPGQSGQV